MEQFEDTFKPQGFLVVCNHGGLEIEISASGDSLRYRYDFGEDNNDPNLDTEIKETEIIYEPNENNPSGDFIAGFMVNDSFYALSDFMRLWNESCK